MEVGDRSPIIFRNALRRIRSIRMEPYKHPDYTLDELRELEWLRKRMQEIHVDAAARNVSTAGTHTVAIEVLILNHHMPEFLEGMAWWMRTGYESELAVSRREA